MVSHRPKEPGRPFSRQRITRSAALPSCSPPPVYTAPQPPMMAATSAPTRTPAPFRAPDHTLVGTGAPQAEQATATIEFPAARADRNGPSLNARRQLLTGKIVYIGAGHGWTADSGAAYSYGWFAQRGINLGMVEDYGNLDQMYIFAQDPSGTPAPPSSPPAPSASSPMRSSSTTMTPPREPTASSPTPAPGARAPENPTSPSPPTPQATTTASPAAPASAPSPPSSTTRTSPRRASTPSIRGSSTSRTTPPPQQHHVQPALPRPPRGRHHRRAREPPPRRKGWVWLGSYRFDAGTTGHVEITSEEESGDPGSVVIADGIRFGNGIGDVNRGEGISGWPREVEASRYWAVRGIGTGTGASSTIYDSVESDNTSDNVGTPPRWAANMNFVNDGAFEDRLYISFHSNAGGGRGCDGLYNDPALFPGTNTTNQEVFAETLGREVNEDIASSTPSTSPATLPGPPRPFTSFAAPTTPSVKSAPTASTTRWTPPSSRPPTTTTPVTSCT